MFVTKPRAAVSELFSICFTVYLTCIAVCQFEYTNSDLGRLLCGLLPRGFFPSPHLSTRQVSGIPSGIFSLITHYDFQNILLSVSLTKLTPLH